MNLIEVIPANEMKLMNDYYNRYAMGESHQAPNTSLTKFLEDWNKSKQNLFHMLGNKLIYKIPCTIKKDEAELKGTINRYLSYMDKFIELFRLEFNWGYDNWAFINKSIFTIDCIYENRTLNDIKLNFIKEKKDIKIPKGTKIIRALNKIIAYLNMPEKVIQELKVFQNNISMIFNDAVIRGNLCLSIHPFDFMTMSDNNSNWSSCMSWQSDGCYKVGSVEMMNANNVICCYLESSNGRMNLIPAIDLKYHPEYTEQQENSIWNDKKWRQLLYVNKDIVLAGKAYPYQSKNLTLKLLNIATQLLKDNLDWKYQFGPELYNDMRNTDALWKDDIDIDIGRSMNKASGHRVKKIYFSTKGMYNDMIADHSPIYWCYRNNIKHNKVISLSGKTHCLCCGFDLLTYDSEWNEGEYNGRYIPSGNLYCEDCREDYSCEECDSFYMDGIEDVPIFYFDSVSKRLCPKCMEKVYKCSNCNNNILFGPDVIYIPSEIDKKTIYSEELTPVLEGEENARGIKRLCLCRECYDKIDKERIYFSSISSDYNYSYSVISDKKFENMGYDSAVKYIDLKN